VRALALRELAREKEARHDPRGLEHAFDLLSLTFAREPMQLAYGALAASDPFLRGVALEYLDAVLPEPLRTAIAAHLEDAAPPSVGATTAPLASLLQSRDAILLHVDELRRLREKADEPEVP